jgi:hypothetical protein
VVVSVDCMRDEYVHNPSIANVLTAWACRSCMWGSACQPSADPT